MLTKSLLTQSSIHYICLISIGLCTFGTAQAQIQRPAVQPQAQPQTQPPNTGVQPGGAAQPGATKVQTKQLQQMFQAQSAQNQSQYGARQQVAPGQQPTAQPGTAQQQPAGQPVMRQPQFGQQQAGQQQAGQQQFGQGQASQMQQGQFPPSQGQIGQAQSAQGQPNSGQNPGQNAAQNPVQNSGPMALTPEQAAAVALAQQQANAGGGINPVAPFPALTKEWQDYLEKVLDKWELESGKVQKFQCEFVRYQYDPTLVTEDCYTLAQGELKYMQPDKGLFKVNTLKYHAGKDDKGQPKYELNAQKQFGEYWICDGENVHLLDRNEKVCTIYQLPPQVRGAGIKSSPLPFVFGVKKQEMKSRYWIKPLPQPKDRPNEIWLEVYPRRADDASNYLKLQVVLDLRDWMPMGLIVFTPNWRPDAPHRELYQFDKRVVNATNILPQIFQKEFIPAKPPADWKVLEEKYQEPQAQPAADQPRVAQPPQFGAPVVK